MGQSTTEFENSLFLQYELLGTHLCRYICNEGLQKVHQRCCRIHCFSISAEWRLSRLTSFLLLSRDSYVIWRMPKMHF